MEHMGNLDDLGIAPQIRIRNYLTAQGWTVQKYVARNSGTYTEIAFMVRFTIPSGKHTKSYGKSHFLMGTLTISMAMFNSYVKLPEGNPYFIPNFIQWGYVYVRGYDVQHSEVWTRPGDLWEFFSPMFQLDF